MLSKFNAIVRNTFIETIRQPIFGILMWLAVGMLVLNPSLSTFSLESGKDAKIMHDVGLATLLLFGLLASAFSATGVVTREIENRTALTVISKPVGRPLFIVAKYVGVSGALLLAFYFLCLVFFMTVRHGVLETVSDPYDQPVLIFSGIALGVSLIAAVFGNYVYGWHFPTALTAWVIPLTTLAMVCVLFISPKWELRAPTDPGALNLKIVYAVVMIFCAVLVLTACAVVLSTRFSQVITLVMCAAVFILGLLSDHLVGAQLARNPNWLYHVLYAVLPNFQFFWVADALTQDFDIPGTQVLRVVGYSALYVPAILGLGVAMFQTREVG